MASTYQYWRISCTKNFSSTVGNGLVCQEWKFFDASGNQISTAGATATASSILNAFYPASNIIDGTGNYWITNTTPSVAAPVWIQVQFSSQVTVKSISYQVNQLDWQNCSPTDFTIQGSNDGSSWITLQSYTDIWWFGAQQTQTFVADNTVGSVRVANQNIEVLSGSAKVRTSRVPLEILITNAKVRASTTAIETLVPNLMSTQPIIFIIT